MYVLIWPTSVILLRSHFCVYWVYTWRNINGHRLIDMKYTPKLSCRLLTFDLTFGNKNHFFSISFVSTGHWAVVKSIVSHLPGGHMTPPKFGYLPPPNLDILLCLAHFSWLFRLTAHRGHQGWEGGGA